jgi:hypothetical protein
VLPAHSEFLEVHLRGIESKPATHDAIVAWVWRDFQWRLADVNWETIPDSRRRHGCCRPGQARGTGRAGLLSGTWSRLAHASNVCWRQIIWDRLYGVEIFLQRRSRSAKCGPCKVRGEANTSVRHL